MPIVTKYINGYKIHAWDDTPEEIFNPVKSASVESEKISSWGRLQKLQETYQSPTKSAATEGHKISAFGRLHQLRSS
jgi:hypothetical protein